MDRKPEHGYGFYKTAAVTFSVEVGNVFKNAKKIIEYINKAEEEHVQLIVFPELSITGYTCADMFLRNDFIKQAEYAFRDVKAATAKNLYWYALECRLKNMANCTTVPYMCRVDQSLVLYQRHTFQIMENSMKKDGLYHPPAVKQIPSVFVEALSHFLRNFSSVGMTALLSEPRSVKICGLTVRQVDY